MGQRRGSILARHGYGRGHPRRDRHGGLHRQAVDFREIEAVGLAARSERLQLRLPVDLSVAVNPDEYSPSYGVTVPCLAVEASVRASIEPEQAWEFEIARA